MKQTLMIGTLLLGTFAACSLGCSSEPEPEPKTRFVSPTNAENMSREEIEAFVQDEYRAALSRSEVGQHSQALMAGPSGGGEFCRYEIHSCGPGCAISMYCCGTETLKVCWASPQ